MLSNDHAWSNIWNSISRYSSSSRNTSLRASEFKPSSVKVQFLRQTKMCANCKRLLIKFCDSVELKYWLIDYTKLKFIHFLSSFSFSWPWWRMKHVQVFFFFFASKNKNNEGVFKPFKFLFLPSLFFVRTPSNTHLRIQQETFRLSMQKRVWADKFVLLVKSFFYDKTKSFFHDKTKEKLGARKNRPMRFVLYNVNWSSERTTRTH